MQELIINGLLTVVILTAVILRFFIGARADSGMTKKQKVMLTRILTAAAMLLGLQLLSAEAFAQIDSYLFPSAGRWVRFALYLVDYFIIGYDILRKALKGILNRQVLSGGRVVPGICRRQEPPQHQRSDGHSPRLCQRGAGRQVGTGRSR